MPVDFHKGSGSYVHSCPRPRSEHMSMGQASHPPTRGTTPCVWSVLSCPLWPCNHRTCHRLRDGAVSIGSHMQQGMEISLVPPHLGAPFPLFDTVQVRKPRSKKNGVNFPSDMAVLRTRCSTCLTPRWAQDIRLRIRICLLLLFGNLGTRLQ